VESVLPWLRAAGLGVMRRYSLPNGRSYALLRASEHPASAPAPTPAPANSGAEQPPIQ
jgi:hypothetical protein